MSHRVPDALELAVLAGALTCVFAGAPLVNKGPDDVPAKDKRWRVGTPRRGHVPFVRDNPGPGGPRWYVAAFPAEIDVPAMGRCIEEGWLSPHGGAYRRVTAAGFEAAMAALRGGAIPDGWSKPQAEAVLENLETRHDRLRSMAFVRPKGAEEHPLGSPRSGFRR